MVVNKSTYIDSTPRTQGTQAAQSTGPTGHSLLVSGKQLIDICNRADFSATSPPNRSCVRLASRENPDVKAKFISFPPQPLPVGGPTYIEAPTQSTFEQPDNVRLSELSYHMLGALMPEAKEPASKYSKQLHTLRQLSAQGA